MVTFRFCSTTCRLTSALPRMKENPPTHQLKTSSGMKWSLALGADPWGRGGSRFEGQVMPPAAGGIPPDPPIFFKPRQKKHKKPHIRERNRGCGL